MTGKGRRKLGRAFDGLLGEKQDKLKLIPALLGVYKDGIKTITVAGREDFVWCRVRGSDSEIVQAFNETVGHHWDLPILIYRDPNAPDIYKVYGRDIRQYEDWGGLFSSTRPHGRSHSFGRPEGNDPVWIYKRQNMSLLPRPVISGTLGIFIEPEFYYFGGRYHWWPGSGTTSLAAFKPTGSVNGRFVTVYIDGASGNPTYLSGDEFNAYIPPKDPGEFIDIPNASQGIPIAAVFLLTGTDRIGWGEIYDLRQPETPVPTTGSALQIYDDHVSQGQVGGIDFLDLLEITGVTGTTAFVDVAPPVTGSFVVYDEGTLLGSALGLNVTGEQGELVLSGTSAHLMLTGTSPPVPTTGSITVYDEGVLQGQADSVNMIGTGVEVVLSGSVAHVMHTGTAPPVPTTGSVTIHDEGVLQGQADTIDFLGAGVSALVAGDKASITIPGGGGGGTPVSVSTGTIYVEEIIFDQELGSATGSFVVASIPQTFDHLKIILLARTAKSSAFEEDGFIYFNGDTTDSNYKSSKHAGGSGHITGTSDSPIAFSFTAADAPAAQFGRHVGWIFEYTDLGKKAAIRTVSGRRADTEDIFTYGHFVTWEDTAAVSSLEITPEGANNFSIGSRLQVIGVSNKIVVTEVSGGGGGTDPPVTGSFVLFDEGSILGSVLGVNFTGDNVEAVISGSFAHVMITGTAGDGGGALVVSTGTIYVEEVLHREILAVATGSMVAAGLSQDFDHLKIIINARGDGSYFNGGGYIFFNADTTIANYYTERHTAGAGAATHSVVNTDNPLALVWPGALALADEWGQHEILISEYSNSGKRKVADSEIRLRDGASSAYMFTMVLNWENTDAIESIIIDSDTINSDNFVTGTYFSVLGIREKVVVTDVSGGGVSDFLGLTDTPSSFSGQSGTVLAVNPSENAVEFVNRAPGALVFFEYRQGTTDISISSSTFADMDEMIITGTFGQDDILEVHFAAGVGHASNNGVTQHRLTVDGSVVVPATKTRTPALSVGPAMSLLYITEIDAGTHVIKAQWAAEAGTARNRAASGTLAEHRQLLVKGYKG